MPWRPGLLAAGVLAVAVFSVGCASDHATGIDLCKTYEVPPAVVDSPRVSRSQQPDAAAKDPLLSPTLPPEAARMAQSTSPGAPLAVRQTSLSPSRDKNASAQPGLGKVRVSVRAWVNEKPIFDEEVRTACYPYLVEISRLPEPQRTARQVEVFKRELDQIIDREVIIQDVYRKLEKNRKVLDKLLASADKEFDKQLASMKKRAGLKTEQELKDLIAEQGSNLESMRRQFQRNFISMEYMKSRIYPLTDKVGHQEIREYYDQHRNEFQTVDGVKWQDLFIAVGAKHRTLADARRFGEQLAARLRQGEDIKKLLEFDDGDSRFRNGDGYGQRRGEIKPPELEPYLFKMRDGDVGPVVELSTGVHVFRLVKREFAGQLPFSDTVQNTIRNKLKGDIANREYKRILDELRSKAIVEVVRDTTK